MKKLTRDLATVEDQWSVALRVRPNYELLVDLTGLFELGLELGAAIDLDGLDRERHLGDDLFEEGGCGGGAVEGFAVRRGVDEPRIDLDQAAGLSGLRSGGRRTAKRRLAHGLRAAFVGEMSDASFELQPHLEGAKLTMPPEMISKRNHFRLLPPHWWLVKRDL
jgi:hypothetical protein